MNRPFSARIWTGVVSGAGEYSQVGAAGAVVDMGTDYRLPEALPDPRFPNPTPIPRRNYGMPTYAILAAALLVGSTDGATAPATSTPAATPATTVPTAPPEAGKGVRVAGEVPDNVELVLEGEEWRFGRMRIEAPLPQGYPAPTPAGTIEIKTYPSVRRAEVTASGNSNLGSNLAFWPLFNHIKDRDIAMTSPVEMDYRGMASDDGKSLDESKGTWTMSFLYRTADLGPTGEDGRIKIVDAPPVTVLSIGMRGGYGMSRVNEGLAKLREWLAANPQWEACGEPRALNYNGPAVRMKDKWSEVQLPVRLAAADAPAPAAAPLP
jgi:hypothetical protein